MILRHGPQPRPDVPPPAPWVTEGARLTWDLDDCLGDDRRFRGRCFSKLPERFQRPVAEKYRELFESHGNREANLLLLGVSEQVTGPALRLASTDSEILNAAERCADICARLFQSSRSEEHALFTCAHYAASCGVDPAPALDNVQAQIFTLAGALARFCDPFWWRRALRRSVVRRIEHAAISFGLVHRYANLYVSEEVFKRRREQKTRNRRTLESLVAVNELGQAFTLQELADLSVSNPEIRRAELMTRIAGFEKLAEVYGHVGVFLTLTCPSRMHAQLYATGRRNPKYDKTNPWEAQEYLRKIWARIRAKLARKNISPYGMRVAEPQHDATPHWHFLLFVPENDRKELEAVFRHYALQVDGGEPGASEHRLKVVRIDKSKGTATGYIAKYVAKNVDGFGLDCDSHGTDAATAAQRVDAWAAAWGIRQFQQIGGPPVGIYRELRRLSKAPTPFLEQLRAASDAGDWCTYVQGCGGTTASRRDLPVAIFKTRPEGLNKYKEPRNLSILGLRHGDLIVPTRFRTWRIEKLSDSSRECCARPP